MVRDENYTPPFDLQQELDSPGSRRGTTDGVPGSVDVEPVSEDSADDDLVAARDAWDVADSSPATRGLMDPASAADPIAGEQDATDSLAQPFVGRWNHLVSSTNWEKGHIINQWRAALVDAGAASTEYSDEAWARRVGGVTASHVGRLRRVHDAFAESYESYRGLYWTHFLVALDWDDAPLWLEGAAQSGWSVAAMRQQRWQANGGDEASRPSDADFVATDVDEDFDATSASFTQPGQGGGSTKNYGDGPNAIGSGPATEAPDFGDEESLNRVGSELPMPASEAGGQENLNEPAIPLVQPFAGLPELPSDLADAVELLKLAVLRHKTAGWKEISAEAVGQYLQAFGVLIEARGK